MTKNEFRKLVLINRDDYCLRFDDKGYATVTIPFPSASRAKELIKYEKVSNLTIYYSDGIIVDVDALKILLDAWRKNLKALRIQDFDLKISFPKRRQIIDGCLDEFSGLSKLEDLWLDHIRVSKKSLEAIASLKSLKSLEIRFARLTPDSLDILGKSKSFREVNLTGCKAIGPKHADRLKKQLKNVKWVNIS